jgi:TolB-like protein/tetratricopeptide (TPR) repeat protein
LAASLVTCLLLAGMAVVWLIERRRLATAVEQDQLASRSIIVLPFLNLETLQPDDAIASRLAQALGTDLVRFGPTRVTPVLERASEWAGTGDTNDIAEADREIKARAVVTGTERIKNGQLRISVRLINAATGNVLFTKVIETAPAESVVRVEAAITEPVNTILNVKNWSSIGPVARDPGLRNAEAREFIMSGRQLMFRATREDYDASIRCLRKALEIEPKSAIAHAYLAATEAARVHYIPDPVWLQRAKQDALESLRLEPDLPDGHRALGGVLLQTNDMAGVFEEQLRTIEAGGPEERVVSFLGMTMNKLGQPDRALTWLEKARRWTSIPGIVDPNIGDSWRLLEDDQKAEAAYRRAMELRPEDPGGFVGLCYLDLLHRDFTRARALFQENRVRSKAYEMMLWESSVREMFARIEFLARNYGAAEPLYSDLVSDNMTAGNDSLGAMSCASALGRIRQALGDEAGAQSLLSDALKRELAIAQNARDPEALYRIAAIEASLKQPDAAIQYLDKAVSAGWLDARSPRIDPRFDAIANDPRFNKIISDLNKKVSELRRHTGQPTEMALTGESTPSNGKKL